MARQRDTATLSPRFPRFLGGGVRYLGGASRATQVPYLTPPLALRPIVDLLLSPPVFSAWKTQHWIHSSSEQAGQSRLPFGPAARGPAVDPAHVALAFVARRQGTTSMPASSWAHVLSLALGWLPPGEAKAFVQACLEAGLLAGEPAALQVPSNVEVPRGFRLAPGTVPEAPVAQDPFLELVEAIMAGTEQDRGAVLAGMGQVQDEHGGLLDAPAAVLLWASRKGMDVRVLATQTG